MSKQIKITKSEYENLYYSLTGYGNLKGTEIENIDFTDFSNTGFIWILTNNPDITWNRTKYRS